MYTHRCHAPLFFSWAPVGTPPALPQVEAASALRLLLALLNKRGAATSGVARGSGRVGPAPRILWRGVLSWRGIGFAFPPHEMGYRLFVVNAVRELLLVLAGCQAPASLPPPHL